MYFGRAKWVLGQEQLTNTKKDNVVQLLDILKQKSLSNKEASRLINDIISLSKDDTVELHRSKRGLGKKSKLRGNLGSLGKEAAKEYVKDLVEEFIDYFSSSSEEQFTGKEQQVTEEQSRNFVEKMLDRGVLEEVWDRGFVKEILRKVSVATNPFRVLNKLFETNEQQVTEVPQTTEDQQVTTEVPQVTGKQQNTKKQQVMNEDGDTALHLAAMKDDLNTVKYLVEKGVEVDVKNKYGATPLHVASIRGNLEIAQFLLDHGADVNAQVVNGLTPLNWATIHDHLAMVKLLLDHCADVNIKEGESDAAYDFGYGRTPLISAVVACNTEIARLLLDNGADVSIKGRGLTALDFANTKKDKCPEMLALLKDGNIKNSDSRSHCTFTMVTSSATKPSFFISSMLNWVGASTTAALSGIFQGTPALSFVQRPITYSGENSISSSQVGFGVMAFLADVAIRKCTGQKYSRPLDDSLLTLEQIKERRLSAIEKDVKMAISKFEKLDQCPRSSLSNTTISKGIDFHSI